MPARAERMAAVHSRQLDLREITSSIGHFLAGFALALFALSYFLHNGREIFTFEVRALNNKR